MPRTRTQRSIEDRDSATEDDYTQGDASANLVSTNLERVDHVDASSAAAGIEINADDTVGGPNEFGVHIFDSGSEASASSSHDFEYEAVQQ